MRGASLQITVNNNLPPSAPLPSLKQCFIAFLPSASVTPEVRCLISPHQCLLPRGRVDLLIGSCDQTYGGTRHRPPLPGVGEKKADLWVYCCPPPPTANTSFPKQSVIRRSLVATRCRKVQANAQFMSIDVPFLFWKKFFFLSFVRESVRANCASLNLWQNFPHYFQLFISKTFELLSFSLLTFILGQHAENSCGGSKLLH